MSHVCIHKNDNRLSVSASRHDKTTTEGTADILSDHSPRSDEVSDPFKDPEHTGQHEDDLGIVRDPENEGDLEILNRMASGTSDLTNDIGQLWPDYSSPESTSSQGLKPTDNRDTTDCNRFEVQSDTEKISNTNDKDTEEDLEERTRKEDERQARCLQEHDEMYKLEDERLAGLPDKSLDESTMSHNPQSHDDDQGGRAGLDPDHSSMWVPQYIDANMSRSKKRRRRQKNKQEKKRNEGSLGRLLGGKQTKEDEEEISTYDYENSKIKRRHSLNTSGVQGGNMGQERKTKINDCNSEKDQLNPTWWRLQSI